MIILQVSRVARQVPASAGSLTTQLQAPEPTVAGENQLPKAVLRYPRMQTVKSQYKIMHTYTGTQACTHWNTHRHAHRMTSKPESRAWRGGSSVKRMHCLTGDPFSAGIHTGQLTIPCNSRDPSPSSDPHRYLHSHAQTHANAHNVK